MFAHVGMHVLPRYLDGEQLHPTAAYGVFERSMTSGIKVTSFRLLAVAYRVFERSVTSGGRVTSFRW